MKSKLHTFLIKCSLFAEPIIRDPITGVLTKENVSGSTSIDISDSDSESVPSLPISPGTQHRSPVRVSPSSSLTAEKK